MLEGQIHSMRGVWSRLDRGGLEISARGALEERYERIRACSTDLAEAAGILIRQLEQTALAFEEADREGLGRLVATVGLFFSSRPRIPLWALASAAVFPPFGMIAAELGLLAASPRSRDMPRGLHWVPIPEDYEAVWTDAQRWSNLTLDEKVAILQEEHYRVARELGVPPVQVYVEDIPEPFVDWNVVARAEDPRIGRVIFLQERPRVVVDIDDVHTLGPEGIRVAVAHETRHVAQVYYIAHPDQRPDSITLDQIGEWRVNMRNYYKGPDLERYLNQPVERDAQDFASAYMERIRARTEPQ